MQRVGWEVESIAGFEHPLLVSDTQRDLTQDGNEHLIIRVGMRLIGMVGFIVFDIGSQPFGLHGAGQL